MYFLIRTDLLQLIHIVSILNFFNEYTYFFIMIYDEYYIRKINNFISKRRIHNVMISSKRTDALNIL